MLHQTQFSCIVPLYRKYPVVLLKNAYSFHFLSNYSGLLKKTSLRTECMFCAEALFGGVGMSTVWSLDSQHALSKVRPVILLSLRWYRNFIKTVSHSWIIPVSLTSPYGVSTLCPLFKIYPNRAFKLYAESDTFTML